MKANELKIKNLVNHSIYGDCEITALDYEMICIQRNDLDIKEWFDLENFKPIPLTEKWLKDFGYFIVETNECVEAFKENFRYSIQQVEENVNWFWCDGETVLTTIKYVHQLQNLYFALTGTELTLNQ